MRKHVKYLVAVTSILTALFAARPSVAQGTLLWQRNLNPTVNGRANSVALDNLGNVIAAGSTVSNFTVAKFNPHGTLLWQQSLNGTANNRYSLANSVAVDNLGNVVAEIGRAHV